MNNKIVLPTEAKPIWKASRGHANYRGGSGAMGDRRTKRLRTRGEKNRKAIKDFS
jgi:hypothetical protein